MAELEIKEGGEISREIEESKGIEICRKQWVSLDSLQKRDAAKREQLLDKLAELCDQHNIIDGVFTNELCLTVNEVFGEGQ